jgi:hypothetical protein
MTKSEPERSPFSKLKIFEIEAVRASSMDIPALEFWFSSFALLSAFRI